MSADDPNPNTAKDRGFGELNDVSAPTIQKRLHIQKDHTIGAMARAARDTYIPNALANVGQFKGVVLRVVMGPETTSQDGQPAVQEQGGWFTSFYGEGEEGLGTLVEIKVRVPEVSLSQWLCRYPKLATLFGLTGAIDKTGQILIMSDL